MLVRMITKTKSYFLAKLPICWIYSSILVVKHEELRKKRLKKKKKKTKKTLWCNSAIYINLLCADYVVFFCQIQFKETVQREQGGSRVVSIDRFPLRMSRWTLFFLIYAIPNL